MNRIELLYNFKDFRESMDIEKANLQGRFDTIPLNLVKITIYNITFFYIQQYLLLCK